MISREQEERASGNTKGRVNVGGPFLFGGIIGLIFNDPSAPLDKAFVETAVRGIVGAVGWGVYDLVKKKSASETIMELTAYGTGVFIGTSTTYLVPPLINMIKNYLG